MARFDALPGAVVGRGPRHPYEPDPSPAGEIAEFLEEHPALRRDPGYVAFLERYGHATIHGDGDQMIIDLLGFGDAETHMCELEGPIVDDGGYLLFAMCVYDDIRDGALVSSDEYDFAFHMTDARDWAVYRNHATMAAPEPTAWAAYAPDFTTWLTTLIANDCRPSHQW